MTFLNYLINGLQAGSIYALIALGYTMVYGIVRLINFAHGDIMMVGAYVSLFCLDRFGLPLWATVLVTMVFCGLLGVIIERFAYKPLRKSPRISALITAIGISLLLQNVVMINITRKDRAHLDEEYEKIFHRFPRLQERRNQLAGTLSGGEQQMLAIGRALMSKPKLLLMDEPSMGLSPILVQEIFRIIRDVRESGTTVLLVEQNAQMALAIADRAYVLETGKVAFHGNAHELLGNEQVRRAYLGK